MDSFQSSSKTRTATGNPMSAVISAILRRELVEGRPLVLNGSPVNFSARELAHLNEIGLIDYRAGKPPIVRSFGPQELIEIFHLCGVFEVGAIRLGYNRINPERLQSVQSGMQSLIRAEEKNEQWSRSVLDHIHQLHDLILSNCSAERLAWEISRYDQLMESVRELVAGQPREMVDSLQQFIRMIDALLGHDTDTAATILSNHFRAAALRRIDLIFGSSACELLVDPSLIVR
jgi:DNA-binding GntR family transcriptional regulator